MVCSGIKTCPVQCCSPRTPSFGQRPSRQRRSVPCAITRRGACVFWTCVLVPSCLTRLARPVAVLSQALMIEDHCAACSISLKSSASSEVSASACAMPPMIQVHDVQMGAQGLSRSRGRGASSQQSRSAHARGTTEGDARSQRWYDLLRCVPVHLQARSWLHPEAVMRASVVTSRAMSRRRLTDSHATS